MECSAPDVTLGEAVAQILVFTAVYVGCLYLPFNHGPRNDGRVIMSRMASLSVLAMLFEAYVRRRVTYMTHADAATSVRGVGIGGALTALLYGGHLVVTPRQRLATYSMRDHGSRLIVLRTYVVAPLLEEWVFRRQTLAMWSCQAVWFQLTMPALLFSAAHLHHTLQQGIGAALFHMSYTFLFGVYAAALHVRTTTVWAPYAAHVVCNVLEIPDFAAVGAHARWRWVAAFYAGCIVLFAVAFAPLTAMARPMRTAWQ